MQSDTKKPSGFDHDILEWNIPEEVLAVLLKDRSTGQNLIWATDDYAEHGKGFGANDEMETNLRYMRPVYLAFPNCHTLCDKLSWLHSCLLADEDNSAVCDFYFSEAMKYKWSVRDLQRERAAIEEAMALHALPPSEDGKLHVPRKTSKGGAYHQPDFAKLAN